MSIVRNATAGKNKNPSIIVLGSKGFIGSAVTKSLIARYKKKVRGMSSRDIDLTRKSSINRLSQLLLPQTVLVFVSGIRAERDSSLSAFEKNIAMMVNTAKAIEKRILKQCIYLSTASVYGSGAKKGKITESSPLVLDSLYALAKYTGEEILKRACAQKKIPLLILRLPRVYGREDKYASYGPSAFIRDVYEKGGVTLYGDGKEKREFLYVEDVGNIIARAIASNIGGVVNVVSGTSHSFLHVIELLRAIAKTPFTTSFAPRDKLSHDEHYHNKTFQKLFPRYSFTPLKRGLLSTCRREKIHV